MFVSEQVHTSFTSAIVQITLDQHAQQGAFSSVDYNIKVSVSLHETRMGCEQRKLTIAHDGYPSFDDILNASRGLADENLASAILVFGGLS